jgi:hypothetical protein
MKHTLDIATPVALLFRMLLVMCILLLGVTAATATGFAQPCDDVDVNAAADEPCSEPCPGESPERGDCQDDCQFCSCCSVAAPSALAYTPVSSGLNILAFRGDLPPSFATVPGGINPGVFKPPRHFSA